MNIGYQIIPEENLLLLKFSGEWSMDDYKNSVNKFIELEGFESIQKILSDFREVVSHSAVGEIRDLVEIREKVIKKKYDHVRIVTDPFATALAHLYQGELSTKGYLDNYCSTVERATSLLKLNLKTKEIEKLLDNLERKF